MYIEAFRPAFVSRLLTLCVTATFMTSGMAEVAHPRDRLYLQVDRGIGHLGLRVQDTKPDGLEGATNQAPGRAGDVLRLSTGLSLHGVLRIALDSTHFSRVEREYRSSSASLKLKRNMHSLGVGWQPNPTIALDNGVRLNRLSGGSFSSELTVGLRVAVF